LDTLFLIFTAVSDIILRIKEYEDKGYPTSEAFGKTMAEVPLFFPLILVSCLGLIFLGLLTQYHYRITFKGDSTHEQLKGFYAKYNWNPFDTGF
jgi:hypothetical protein